MRSAECQLMSFSPPLAQADFASPRRSSGCGRILIGVLGHITKTVASITVRTSGLTPSESACAIVSEIAAANALCKS
jgi:hypothetical protein